MIQKKAIRLHPYGQKLLIVVSDNVEEIRKVLPEWDDEPPYAHTFQTKDIHKKTVFAMVLNPFGKPKVGEKPMCLNTIAHEAVHITNKLFDYIGYTPEIDNDEPQAYMVDYIVNETVKALDKMGVLTKIKIYY